jgi:hypothetical protein
MATLRLDFDLFCAYMNLATAFKGWHVSEQKTSESSFRLFNSVGTLYETETLSGIQ